jgi:hypothetical protein
MLRVVRFSTLTLMVTAAFALTACAPQVITPPAETLTASPVSHRTVVPSPPEDPRPTVIWPLTGLSAGEATQVELDRPAVGVKIENTARGRPQKGIEFADIVFEEYINASCTRLLAVYQSNYPEDVGPIRSARMQDPNIFGSFYGVFVASGSNHGVQNAWWKTDQLFLADDFQHTGSLLSSSKGFHRVTRSQVDKDQEFRLWGHVATFSEEGVEKGIGATHQQFDFAYPGSDATAALDGAAVGTIDVKFSNCAHPHWVWDEAVGTWQRYEFEDPDVSMDGTPVTASNVLLLQVKVAYTQASNPESFVVVTGAPGYVATGGKVIPIIWSKADRRDDYHMTTLDGTPIVLAPGQTWVELVPLSGAKTKAVISFDGVVQ